MALLNENPIEIPCCKGHTIQRFYKNDTIPACPANIFIDCFRYMENGCEFEKICDDPYDCQQ